MKKKRGVIILGIETSCDETAASLLQIIPPQRDPASAVANFNELRIISNVVSSQVKIHAKYGGIVPEVAARQHAENIIGVLEAAIANQHKFITDYTNKKFVKISEARSAKIRDYSRLIDAIAVTNGPGLITSLLVGVEAAKTLAFLAKKPLIPVNHLAGHIYANFVGDADKRGLNADLRRMFPAICLIVSGGHTELVLMDGFEKFQKIGQTLDDAAGECFDKAAKILGLGYPGGPAIAAIANQHKSSSREFAQMTHKSHEFISDIRGQIRDYSRDNVSKLVNIRDIKLPRPMINSGDFNFSFSGLKTAVLYKVQKMSKLEAKKNSPEICSEAQQAVIDVLISKTIRAAKKFSAKSIILGGGVVANQELRRQFAEKVKKEIPNSLFFIPNSQLCTDNAAMIAAAGYFKLMAVPKKDWLKKFDWCKIKTDPNLEI